MVLAILASACSRELTDSPPGEPSEGKSVDGPSEGARWLLSGSDDERFERVAKHLRGFDMAMVETGYRYDELYWAGKDGNWDFCLYQVEKIRTAVRNGAERRPKRAASAAMLEGALQAVEEAARAKDRNLFAKNFEALTATCNACHHAERVEYIRVQPPTFRISPVGSQNEGGQTGRP